MRPNDVKSAIFTPSGRTEFSTFLQYASVSLIFQLWIVDPIEICAFPTTLHTTIINTVQTNDTIVPSTLPVNTRVKLSSVILAAITAQLQDAHIPITMVTVVGAKFCWVTRLENRCKSCVLRSVFRTFCIFRVMDFVYFDRILPGLRQLVNI